MSNTEKGKKKKKKKKKKEKKKKNSQKIQRDGCSTTP